MSDLDTSSDTISHPLIKYKNHLEFNGYRVEEEDDDAVIFCYHPRKPNLKLSQFGTRGVLVSTIFGVKQSVDRLELLEYINELNAEFVFMKAYFAAEDSLFLETFFEGEYDRVNFSILLENIEHDIDRLFKHELTKKFVE